MKIGTLTFKFVKNRNFLNLLNIKIDHLGRVNGDEISPKKILAPF